MSEGSEIRQEVLKLMQQKDRIENEIKELTSILTKNGVGMSDPLVDPDGFPINTIDIYQVRHARQKIICLQNDHKATMKQIENGLQGYYSSTANIERTRAEIQDAEMRHDLHPIHEVPFAKITLVSPGSPADCAQIHENDMLVEFGSVNITNFKDVTDIAAVVQHSEDQRVHLKLKRGEHYIVTQLIPKKWAGRGLLGCSIAPLDT